MLPSGAWPRGREPIGKNDTEGAFIIKVRGKYTGVYRITTPSGRVYVGSSKDVRKRANKHASELRKGIHPNAKLQRSWDKYRRLSLEPIYRCEASQLARWEQVFINELEPSLNILKVAYSGSGYKHTPEAIEKIRARSQKHKGAHLKEFRFKPGDDNWMRKGKWAPCHEATSKPIKATKEGCKPRRFKSAASAARFFKVLPALVQRRAQGRISAKLKGWEIEYDG